MEDFIAGRYETGGLNAEAKVVKGETNISSQTWYTMYEKSKELRGNNSNVRTSMIWGCQWDATLEWLVKSGSKTYSEVGSNSGSWGNYVYGTVDGHGSKQPTGYREEWKANNIYDLAGNVEELTLEYHSYGRVGRGGFTRIGYGYYPAGKRFYENPTYDRSTLTDFPYNLGMRATLYVSL